MISQSSRYLNSHCTTSYLNFHTLIYLSVPHSFHFMKIIMTISWNFWRNETKYVKYLANRKGLERYAAFNKPSVLLWVAKCKNKEIHKFVLNLAFEKVQDKLGNLSNNLKSVSLQAGFSRCLFLFSFYSKDYTQRSPSSSGFRRKIFWVFRMMCFCFCFCFCFCSVVDFMLIFHFILFQMCWDLSNLCLYTVSTKCSPTLVSRWY